MTTIETSIDVQVPVSTAYDQWTQFEEFPRFMEGVVSVTQMDDSHVTGSRRSEGSGASGTLKSSSRSPIE